MLLLDYSNYALSIKNNDTGIVLTSFNASQFTIIFWFYLENNANANLISLKDSKGGNVFKISIFSNRLLIHYLLKNPLKSIRTTTLIDIPTRRWKHFAWSYSAINNQSLLDIDGERQQSIDFEAMSLDFESK